MHEIGEGLRRARGTLEKPAPPARNPHLVSWRPVLEGDLAARARATVLELAEALSAPDGRHGTRLLCDRALFFAYLGEAEDDERWVDVSRSLLDGAIACVEKERPRASLCGGFVQVAWTLEHLGRGTYASAALDEPIDGLLCPLADVKPWPGELGLFYGLTGLGIYTLERSTRSRARECLSLIVDRLTEEAEPRDGGITWRSKPHMMRPEDATRYADGYFDCGVAQGVPGTIPVLAGAVRENVNRARARQLLDGAMRWLLANRLGTASPSMFPYHVTPNGFDRRAARMGWCYGDTGIAAAMLAAAKAVNEPAWVDEALAIARHAIARPLDDECRMNDAGLCHGASGLAVLYGRMWQSTGDLGLRAAAIQWYLRTLKMQVADGGIRGHRAQVGSDLPESTRSDQASLYEGATGTALALLAGYSSIAPAWDVLLGASLPIASRIGVTA